MEPAINSFDKVRDAENKAQKMKEDAFSKKQEIIEKAELEATQILKNEEKKAEDASKQLTTSKKKEISAFAKEIEEQAKKDISNLKQKTAPKIDEATNLILKGLMG